MSKKMYLQSETVILTEPRHRRGGVPVYEPRGARYRDPGGEGVGKNSCSDGVAKIQTRVATGFVLSQHLLPTIFSPCLAVIYALFHCQPRAFVCDPVVAFFRRLLLCLAD